MAVIPDDDSGEVYEEEETKHHFKPGDHIRYRISGIGPLSIYHHAIVLHVGQENVIIVDFNVENKQPSSFQQFSSSNIVDLNGNNTQSSSFQKSFSSSRNDNCKEPCNIIESRDIFMDELIKYEKVPETATLEKPDHPSLVLSRANFIIHNKELIPPYNIQECNCECMAVWCKTGKWLTVQGLQFALYKELSPPGVAIPAVIVACLAPVVTVPASGFFGFLGFSTQVTLAVSQPWILPAMVVGTIAATRLIQRNNVTNGKRMKKIEETLNIEYWRIFFQNLPVHLLDHIHSFLE